MPIISVWYPGEFNNVTGFGGPNPSVVTQFFTNPWGSTKDNFASDVFIQCTPAWVLWGSTDFAFLIGILEVNSLDRNGNHVHTVFGNETDLADNLSISGAIGIPNRLYVSNFLNAVILLGGYNATVQGSVTLFLWS